MKIIGMVGQLFEGTLGEDNRGEEEPAELRICRNCGGSSEGNQEQERVYDWTYQTSKEFW